MANHDPIDERGVAESSRYVAPRPARTLRFYPGLPLDRYRGEGEGVPEFPDPWASQVTVREVDPQTGQSYLVSRPRPPNALPDFSRGTSLGEPSGADYFALYSQVAITQIAALYGFVDSYPEERHELRSTKSGYPVESGAHITDHIVAQPKRLSLVGFVSDLLFSEFSARQPTGSRRAEAAWAELEKLQRNAEVVGVTTMLGDYSNMAIVSVSADVNVSSGRSLRFRIDLEELQVRRITGRAFVWGDNTPAQVGANDIVDDYTAYLHDIGAYYVDGEADDIPGAVPVVPGAPDPRLGTIGALGFSPIDNRASAREYAAAEELRRGWRLDPRSPGYDEAQAAAEDLQQRELAEAATRADYTGVSNASVAANAHFQRRAFEYRKWQDAYRSGVRGGSRSLTDEAYDYVGGGDDAS